MKVKSWAKFIIFIFLFIQFIDSQAQKIQKSYSIHWEDTRIYSPSEDITLEFLYFKGGVSGSDFPDLPLFHEKIAVDRYFGEYEVSLQNVRTVPLSKEEIKLLPENFDIREVQVSVQTITEKNKHYASFSLLPFFRDGSGNFQKITDFDITVNGKSTVAAKPKSYTPNSILSTGNWYKIAVEKTGLHKVSYADLAKMGVPVSNLSSSSISLFGNGGGMLPESNSIERPDDLVENPILLYDGNDGTFNESDYFVFYALGPHSWNYDSVQRTFSHATNIYSDYAYYFINVDPGIGEGKRITAVDNRSLVPNHTANTYTHYDFHEKDEYNYLQSGQEWFGEAFSSTVTSHDFTFTIPSIISARISVKAAFQSPESSTLKIVANGTHIEDLSGAAGNADAVTKTVHAGSVSASSPLKIRLDFNPTSLSYICRLDWIRVVALCSLRMHSPQFPFCNPESIGDGNITRFEISASDRNTTVWDVTVPTRPFQIVGSLDEGVYSVLSPTEKLRKFVAFNGSSFLPVTTVGKINNQNLHQDEMVDMVIVCHPNFLSQAGRLAEYRTTENNLRVKIVTPEQIYNEFSSGAQDPTAIRDYIRMIYNKSGYANPQYLLLFGRPSYDYRGRTKESALFIPNYQNRLGTTLSKNSSRGFDDYFALLDPNEGTSGLLDIAVGRFPVSTATEAKIAVDKTIHYSSKTNLVYQQNSTVVSNLADWRNIITFIADDEDDNSHVKGADSSARIVAQVNKTINIEKIYSDAFKQESHSGGQRYPEVNAAINSRMERGTFIMAYTGHGGQNGWAEERILTLSEISAWNNLYNQPILITLTCEFSWYDRPATSPGEMAFLNARGGAAGLITTSRVAYTHSNDIYSYNLYSHLFDKIDGRNKTLGEVNRITKNLSGNSALTNMIIVLGDPSMPLAMPELSVVTDSINGFPAEHYPDTVKAYSKVTVKGRITDDNGNTVTGFNGNIFPSVFDKAVTSRTLLNDPKPNVSPFEFELQKNILFKGNASVKNGFFEFTFIVPKDINYTYGDGKISYYARASSSDAAGYFDRFTLGGISDQLLADSIGPEIEIYLNDESFVSGGTTNQNPKLIVKLKDDHGINTTGNGIGHDLVAILDNATESPIILNDYYEAQLDSFNCGRIAYQLKDLSVGKHTIEIRAWDIANNLSKSKLNFEVVSDEKLVLDHVLNYPNPFTTRTDFYFEQNQPGDLFDIMVQIFTISGKLVKTISVQQHIEGNRCQPITWNGRDDYGDKLAKGVYLYRMKVRNQQGEIAEKIEKLVIL